MLLSQVDDSPPAASQLRANDSMQAFDPSQVGGCTVITSPGLHGAGLLPPLELVDPPELVEPELEPDEDTLEGELTMGHVVSVARCEVLLPAAS